MKTRIDICDDRTGEVIDFFHVNDKPHNVVKFFGLDVDRYWQCQQCDEWFVEEDAPYYEISDQPGSLFCGGCCPYRPDATPRVQESTE